MIHLIVTSLMFLASVAMAVEPHEILPDHALEERARDISKGLRCPVCQNESIDGSSAEIAADLRVLVRERLVAGDSDREVVDFVVARYGEFVLLQPSISGVNLFLWSIPPLMLLIALVIGVFFIRARIGPAGETQDKGLSDVEKVELEKLLKS